MADWHFRDLITDHQTGKLRETLVGSVAFKICALVAYCRFISGANFETVTLTTGSIFLAHEGFARFMNQRQQKIDSAAAPMTSTSTTATTITETKT